MPESRQQNLWPGWQTVKLIGRGSFGEVYELQRDVLGDVEKAALKVISVPQNNSDIDDMYGEGYDEESITSTFQSHLKSIVAEYSLMRKMNGCINIVNCDDIRYIQHEDGIGWDIFIKMELLTPLMKALPAEVPEETAIRVGKDICAALEICKEYDIVHRDIKPQNIFVSSRGDYKLGDFGIAKTVEKTMGGTKIGTYKYMAPEVYNNQPYGTGADIYSLGLVLYWLLNEKRMPFLPLPPAKQSVGMEEEARNRRFRGEPLPEPAHGSEELKHIVLKACAYDPKARYQSATEMLAALNGLSQKQPVPVPVPTPEPELAPVPRPVPKPEPELAAERLSESAPAPVQIPQPVPTLELEPAPVPEQTPVPKPMPAPKPSPEPKPEQKPNPMPPPKPVVKERRKPWWLIAVAAVALVVTVGCVIGFFFGRDDEVELEHTHIWVAANCEEPKTCSICKQMGTPLGHSWENATCNNPKTCTRCGKINGYPLKHCWEELPSGEGKFCSTCGDIQYYCNINYTDVTLELGQEFDLVLTAPDNEEMLFVQWTADSDRVLISGNSIAAVSPGDTVVSAEYDGKVYSCIVRVRLHMSTAPQTIAGAYGGCLVGLKADGTVVAVGRNDEGQCNVGNWRDIVSISAGGTHTVGLKADGTVVAVGSNDYGECDVGNWTDIVSISAGFSHTVGLKADGTVVAVGSNNYGARDVGYWRDIVAISAGNSYTVGLKADGTVIAVGNNHNGQCGVGNWTDIVSISAGCLHTVGLKADGTVIAVGSYYDGQRDVGNWTDIVSISAGDSYTVGLKADGTVVAVGDNDHGQCDVSAWTDIVAISAGFTSTIGLKADGTVVVAGEYASSAESWENIRIP